MLVEASETIVASYLPVDASNQATQHRCSLTLHQLLKLSNDPREFVGELVLNHMRPARPLQPYGNAAHW